MNENFADWLRGAMERRGLRQSQLAAYIGLTPSAVSKWLSGGAKPDPESVAKLAELFHEPLAKIYELAGHPSPDWVPAERPPKTLRDHAVEFLADLPIQVPVHEQLASAGFGDDIIEWAYWERSRAAGRSIVGLRVRGASMAPEIHDGDTIFIDRNLAPEPGDVVVATVQEQVYVKRFETRGSGFVLRGNNGAAAIDAGGAKIEGVVIQISRQVRR